MYDQDDIDTLKKVKRYASRRNKDFSKAINDRNLTEEEMDELFLSS
ncbi:TPA: hypothetical protein HA239_05270 [Candidatus Woesearchaeota archaeon]|nr:hypothetical protein QT06_C0001G0287 [archaeon GW2011_AR15]MBS3103607.1 hypothetical protein [Candidatus Woesearchaeota archaeon]HIH41793.1 hypothetical protein [Candidatus Woesearchaeota archaeon]